MIFFFFFTVENVLLMVHFKIGIPAIYFSKTNTLSFQLVKTIHFERAIFFFYQSGQSKHLFVVEMV